MDHCPQRLHDLSSSRALDQPAELMSCTFSWQHVRLSQFKASTVVSSNDETPYPNDVRVTLDHLKDLLDDVSLRDKYRVVLDQGTSDKHRTTGKAENNDDTNRFSRLFEHLSLDTAPNLGFLQIDVRGMKELSCHISIWVGRLYDMLDCHLRVKLRNVHERDLEEAIRRSITTFDRETVFHNARMLTCPGNLETEIIMEAT